MHAWICDVASSRCPRDQTSRKSDHCPKVIESRCGAVSLGRSYLFPPLSAGGALVVRPWLRFHIPLIEPGLADFPHPALGQDFTPSPTARRAQAGTGVRARSARRGAGVDTSRPCVETSRAYWRVVMLRLGPRP